MLHVWDCTGSGCDAAVEAAFAQRNMSVVSDCSLLDGMTLKQAAEHAALPGGGSALVLQCGLVDHYVPSNTCSGYTSENRTREGLVESGEGGLPSLYTCYADSGTRAQPLRRMWSYLDSVSAAGPPANGFLYSHQALWQEDAASVAVGVLHLSSLLEDESRSTLNALLTARASSGVWNVSVANLVEINNVCDGGAELRAALLSKQREARARRGAGRSERWRGE